jgi:flagellar biosynthesis/type III secretory pathway M-ring protein FliF/YscJ
VQPLAARWTALAPRQRAYVASLAAAALFALAIAMLLQRDSRVALFAEPLRADQVAEVAERLAEWNVPFAATSDNVRLDAKRRNEVLLRLALAGVPHPHLLTTAETLEKASPLAPQSLIDAQQRAGLEGDLASALRGLPGVADAHVIIAPAREDAFTDDAARQATASVRLSLIAGATVPERTLQGVRAFVASGVPALDPKRVTILDDRGLALGDETGFGNDDAGALQQSLQSVLDAALGEGASIVRVRVGYDARAHDLHDVVRRPIGERPIEAATSDERYKSASKQYAKSSASLDRGSEVQDEHVATPAGRVERLSVAVAVDANRGFDLQKIRALATGTLGVDPRRGDSVTIEEFPFPRAVTPVHSLSLAALLGLAGLLGPWLIFAAALFGAFRAGAKPLGVLCEGLADRIALRRAARVANANFPPAHVRGALEREPPHTAAAIISALPAATATAVLELYPPEERAAIVRRMSRAAAPVVPDCESVLRRG